jgi:fucose permease
VWLAFGAVMVAGFALTYTQHHPAREHEEAGGGNVLAEALKLRVVWLGALFLLVYVGAEVSLGSWSYSFLTEERGEAPFLAGLMVSGYWLGLTVGRFVLGRFAERRGSKLLIQLCLAGTVLGVLLVWLVPETIPSALGLWLAGFSLGPIFPSTIALTSEWVPPRLLPSAIGFLASFGAMGAALFPWLAGNLAEAVGLWSLLPYVVALIGLMFLFWWRLNVRR